jgi:hypothetical protein
MPLTVSDKLLQSAHLTHEELKAELALALFQRERLTLGQAAALAGLPTLAFNGFSLTGKFPFIMGLKKWRRISPGIPRRFSILQSIGWIFLASSSST